MRILHFITSLRTGGAERLMVELLPRLRSSGHEVELLVIDGTRTYFMDEIERRGIRVHALGKGRRAMHNPLHALPLRRFLQDGDYDIVHTHNSPCQILAAAVAPRSCKLVTTEHNTDNRRRGNALWRCADRMIYNRYSAIVAVGDEAADSLRSYIPSLTPRIHTIANGIDTASFASAAPAPDIHRQFAGKKIIAMAAAFRPQKDQPTMLRALALLPEEYVLVLAGGGETLDSCRQLSAKLGLSDRVLFAGVRSDVAAIYAAANVTVLSTHYEGFGLAAIEAMACNRPLVASDVRGLRSTVSPGALLFPEGDARALASTIHALCTNQSMWRDTAEACAHHAAAFDIGKTASGYDALYHRLCH